MIVKEVKGIKPILGEGTFVAENAVVTGDVVTGKNCSVWYSAVLRGDVNKITLGECVNVQDGAVIHTSAGKFSTTIGNNVSIGHKAIIHGCTIEENVLIGMGSIVMDGAYVEKNSIIAAGAVVTEGTRVETGSIYGGVPAKRLKSVSKEQMQHIQNNAKNYIAYAKIDAEGKKM